LVGINPLTHKIVTKGHLIDPEITFYCSSILLNCFAERTLLNHMNACSARDHATIMQNSTTRSEKVAAIDLPDVFEGVGGINVFFLGRFNSYI